MKKIQQVSLAFMIAACVFIYSCGPNDSKGSMNQDNSNKEGAVDSTKIPNFDSTHAADSSHASLSGHGVLLPAVQFNPAEVKPAFFEKEKHVNS